MEDKKFDVSKYDTIIGTDWMDEAYCEGEPLSKFYPDKYKDETGAYTKEVKEALSICAKCPVRLECLRFALEQESKPNVAGRYGIWASTPEQRKAFEESKKFNGDS